MFLIPTFFRRLFGLARLSRGPFFDGAPALTVVAPVENSHLTVTHQAGREMIAEEVLSALVRFDNCRPHRMDGPMEVEGSFMNYLAAELLAYQPDITP